MEKTAKIACSGKRNSLISHSLPISADFVKRIFRRYSDVTITVDGKIYGEKFKRNGQVFTWYDPELFKSE